MLLNECSEIQTRLQAARRINNLNDITKKFTNHIINGNINAALRLLDEEGSAGVLPINEETLQQLHNKHPDPSDLYDDLLLSGPRKYIHPIIFETINASSDSKVGNKH